MKIRITDNLRKNIYANYIRVGFGFGSMKTTHPPTDYKGRSLGIVFLIGAQVLVGFIHVVFGFWLLSAPRFEPLTGPDIYSIYTIVFGFLALLFAALLWLQKRAGWVGTFVVLSFVIVADLLTLLDLPSIPGIPKFAGYGEITYSVIIILYLLKTSVRTKYAIIK
jgi:hypothetical protein